MAPSPPPSSRRNGFDDWMMPAGGLALVIAGLLMLVLMRRRQAALGHDWKGAAAVAEPQASFDEFKADAGESDFAALDADGLDQPDVPPVLAPADSTPKAEIVTGEFEAPPLGEAATPLDAESTLHDLLFEPEAHAPPAEPAREVEPWLSTPSQSQMTPPPPSPEVEPVRPAYVPEPQPIPELPQTPPPQAPPPTPMPEIPQPTPAPEIAPPRASTPVPAPTPPMHATAPDNAVDTKLELANAYLEMGDPDAAREMLREVLDEGTVGQRDDARQLLAEIDRNKN